MRCPSTTIFWVYCLHDPKSQSTSNTIGPLSLLKTATLWRAAAAAAKSCQSCPTLWDPIDSSPPGSPVPGILQARTLEWVAISFSSAWKWKVKVKVAQSCPTPSDPMNCSLPGSSVHGIFQVRVLEWGAIAFSCYPLIIREIHIFISSWIMKNQQWQIA